MSKSVISSLLLTGSLMLSGFVYADPADGTFQLKTIGDNKIVAVATYDLSLMNAELFNEVDEAQLLAGDVISVFVKVTNDSSGQELLNERYDVSLPSGTPEVIIGNANIGRLKASYDSSLSILKMRFALNVDDLVSYDFLLSGANPALPAVNPQFRVSLQTLFTSIAADGLNVVVSGSGTIGTRHSSGDAAEPCPSTGCPTPNP